MIGILPVVGRRGEGRGGVLKEEIRPGDGGGFRPGTPDLLRDILGARGREGRVVVP